MSAEAPSARKKITIHHLRAKKQRGEPISMLTGYDYPTALALDRAAVDAILVGDSLGMVVLGYENTLPVTVDEMLHHCKAVARGAQHAHLVADLPFLSYQVSVAQALGNAGRFLKEGGMDAVKIEGGRNIAPTATALVAAGIPVLGHIGLTPQSLHQLGGYKTQGKTAAAARALIDDAQALEQAGCYAIVLEAMPQQVAALITQRLSIPTIGIGAGSGCDGQVLVSHDVLGMFDRFTPKFAKPYAQLHAAMSQAFGQYIAEVGARHFPAPEHSHTMDDAEWHALRQALDSGLR